jgi:hypothetical protein
MVSSGRTTPRLALSQAPEHVKGRKRKDSEPPGFATHMLALAKPPSLLRGRVYCVREEKVVLDSEQMTS